MKSIISTLILLLISGYSQAQVRGTKWGESLKAVRSKEESELLYETKAELQYITFLSALDARLSYFFTDDQLSSTLYVITEDFYNKNLYIREFNDIKSQLIKKYGDASVDTVMWHDPQHKRSPSDHGLAIGMGHVTYFTIWETDNTEIRLALYGKNYTCTLAVNYESLEYSPKSNGIDPGL